VGRKHHDETNERDLEIEWDDNWRYAREVPFAPRSPISIPGLGIAYKVKANVVRANGVAAAAGLQAEDEITSVLYYDAPKGTPEPKKKWQEVKPDQWAHVVHNLNERLFVYGGQVDLKYKRKEKIHEVKLTLPLDESWPIASRGLVFEDDMRLQKADSVGQAIAMGYDEEVETAINIYISLKRMVFDRRISFDKNANGPLLIGLTAYQIAGTSLPGFVWFLAMLSVNLAVINFLPIPVLDGGHMVFLLYEKFVGRAVPELINRTATFAGVALLFSLMLYVIVRDVMKLFF
jgi:regulator of sigma E protease